jgi:hypothetical protein
VFFETVVKINRVLAPNRLLFDLTALFDPGIFFTLQQLALNVPARFFQVFDSIALEVCAPDVFYGVPAVESRVLSHLNALYAAGVASVVRWVVYVVWGHLSPIG